MDDLWALLDKEGLDPFLGLTCDVALVRLSISGRRCPICTSPLDDSRERVRRLSVACSAPRCGFTLNARGRPSNGTH